MTIQPTKDNVLIKEIKEEEITKAGIILSDRARKKTQTALVIATGPGEEDHPMTVKKGDKVIYEKYTGTDIKFAGEDYLILKIDEIMAVIEE